jgi:rubrerythrin
MFNQIDIMEAVRRSIQTEKNAMDFYLRGASQMRHTGARKVFELLAREEREHAHWFHNVYPGDDIPDIEKFLDAVPTSDSDWLRDLEKVNTAGFDERRAMELAMDKEQKLAAHLRSVAQKIDDPGVRAVYEQNARSTDHHYQLIESEYARLMGMVHETDIDTYVRE